MPRIELWEKSGKGVFKAMHNMHRPVALVVLEDKQGNQYPIYEGNNEVPTGTYDVVIIRPYIEDESQVVTRKGSYNYCEVRNGCTINIVDIGDFAGGYLPYDGDSMAWKKLVNSGKLERPIGWFADSANKIISDFNKRIG